VGRYPRSRSRKDKRRQEMGKPEWQDWPEEPWEAFDGDGQEAKESLPEDEGKPWMLAIGAPDCHEVCWMYGWRSLSATRAGQLRIVSCVNALAGIRNPGAVGRVIGAASDARKRVDRILDLDAVDDYTRERLLDVSGDLWVAIKLLDQEPEA